MKYRKVYILGVTIVLISVVVILPTYWLPTKVMPVVSRCGEWARHRILYPKGLLTQGKSRGLSSFISFSNGDELLLHFNAGFCILILVKPVRIPSATVASLEDYKVVSFQRFGCSVGDSRRVPAQEFAVVNSLSISLWTIPVTLSLGLLMSYLIGRMRRSKREGICERCGYDISGSCHERCPECGLVCRSISITKA